MAAAELQPDPYEAFEQWMLRNGFDDVVNCEPRDVNSDRLHEALEQYSNS